MGDDGGTIRRSGRRGLWVAAGVAAVGAVAAVVGVFLLPTWMYTDQGARASLQGGLLTAAAALTAVVGALVALDETRQANAETRRANRDTHVRELYVEAVKLLNDPELGIRLAGIYALERVAVDSQADQRIVVEVLCAFVCERSTDPAFHPPSPAEDQHPARVRSAADIRAAVQVLARLPVRDGIPRADLGGADLFDWASLRRLDLAGGNLVDATLGGADLFGARLKGADLSHAFLQESDLCNATLDGANLTDAWLCDANLALAFLHGANLTGARLEGANLTDAQGLTQEQVDVGEGDGRTRLPEGLTRPARWGTEEPPDEA